MFYSFQSLRVVPAVTCLSPVCLPQVLQDPIFERVPVEDIIGVPYGYDIQLTQGFYLTIVFYVATRTLFQALARAIVARRDKES